VYVLETALMAAPLGQWLSGEVNLSVLIIIIYIIIVKATTPPPPPLYNKTHIPVVFFF